MRAASLGVLVLELVVDVPAVPLDGDEDAIHGEVAISGLRVQAGDAQGLVLVIRGSASWVEIVMRCSSSRVSLGKA